MKPAKDRKTVTQRHKAGKGDGERGIEPEERGDRDRMAHEGPIADAPVAADDGDDAVPRHGAGITTSTR